MLLAGVVVIGTLWLYNQRDTLAADAIRTFGTAALGVPVKLGSAHINVANQSAELRRLSVDNPPGYRAPKFLQLESVTVNLDVASLAGEVVVIREILVRKPDITYENKDRIANLDVIQGNLDRYLLETQKAFGLAPSKKEKRWIIGHVFIQDAVANVSPGILGGKTVSVPLPNIHIRDIGKRSNGATSADATKQVLSALTGTVTHSAGSAIAEAAKGVGGGVKKGVKGIGSKLKSLFGR